MKLTMKERDIRALADKLYRAKRRVFRATLLEVARSFGSPVGRPSLSPEVEAALRSEASEHAAQIAATFNADLEAKAADLPNDELEAWVRARQRRRARPTATTEAYSAHADAILSATRDLGLVAEFDFGGHPELGDADPMCEICQALMATNPHTFDEVVAIGTPHPACAQDWHFARVDVRPDAAAFDNLGTTPGGIVGNKTLIERAGGRQQAVDQVVGRPQG